MAYDKFLIAPLNSGLDTSLKSWMTQDDSFERLSNAYVFRGRIRKRFGGRLSGQGATNDIQRSLYSRLAIKLLTGAGADLKTDAVTGNAADTVPGHIFKPGQLFSIGDVLYTVISNVAGAQAMLCTDPASSGTFNVTNGAFTITAGPLNTQIYFYPAEPVMGLDLYEAGAINNHSAFAFDTQFTYIFAGGRWLQIPLPGPTYLHGNNTNFVWSGNWNGLTPDLTYLFSSNYYALHPTGAADATDDPIYYYTGAAWVAFTPEVLAAGAVATSRISTAKIIVPFKDRLVLLRTIERNIAAATNTEHKGRCRFSHNGSPITPAAGPAVTYGHPFLEPNQTYTSGATIYKGDGGGYIDAPTEEGIVSAEFIKDRLIVFFERSTWELAYTGNQVLPFVWQKINTELGSQSTFSSVPFDKNILTVGVSGIHACNGGNVQRIDTKIPDQVFNIASEPSGVIRVAGVRDYKTEMVYWSYPSFDKTGYSSYPNTVLVYNYQNQSWATNDDCITAFGYFEQSADLTWSQKDYTWAQANFPWNYYFSAANARQVLAGNQEGFVFLVDPGTNVNAPVMQVTNMAYTLATGVLEITIVDHTLMPGDFIKIEDAQGVALGGYGIYKVDDVVDKDTIQVITTIFSGTYLGGGVVTRVSKIDILTKRFNPYVNRGVGVFIGYVEFAVQKTSSGQITVDHYVSSSSLSMLNEATVNNVIMGSGILETNPYVVGTFEDIQTLLWHKVFFQSEGQFVQLRLYLTEDQMLVPAIVDSGFGLEAFILNTTSKGEL